MRAVIDESVPRRLAAALRERGHDVSSFPSQWKGLRNGQLLSRMTEEAFDCLLTCDKNLRFQQTIGRSRICLIVLPVQRYPELHPLLEEIDRAILAAEPGGTTLVAARRLP